jgi:hypothetical protein
LLQRSVVTNAETTMRKAMWRTLAAMAVAAMATAATGCATVGLEAPPCGTLVASRSAMAVSTCSPSTADRELAQRDRRECVARASQACVARGLSRDALDDCLADGVGACEDSFRRTLETGLAIR